jgi:hypothetical protein
MAFQKTLLNKAKTDHWSTNSLKSESDVGILLTDEGDVKHLTAVRKLVNFSQLFNGKGDLYQYYDQLKHWMHHLFIESANETLDANVQTINRFTNDLDLKKWVDQQMANDSATRSSA